MEESLILAGIVKPIKIQRLYVKKEWVEKSKGIIKDIYGEENEGSEY